MHARFAQALFECAYRSDAERAADKAIQVDTSCDNVAPASSGGRWEPSGNVEASSASRSMSVVATDTTCIGEIFTSARSGQVPRPSSFGQILLRKLPTAPTQPRGTPGIARRADCYPHASIHCQWSRVILRGLLRVDLRFFAGLRGAFGAKLLSREHGAEHVTPG